LALRLGRHSFFNSIVAALKCYQCTRLENPLDRPIVTDTSCQSTYTPKKESIVECSELDYGLESLKNEDVLLGKNLNKTTSVTF